jgi:hypothetical protein
LVAQYEDGSRQREYLGADPKARAAALARVKAWDELQAVKSEMREIDHRLAAITGHLDSEPRRNPMGRLDFCATNAIINLALSNTIRDGMCCVKARRVTNRRR